MADPAPETLADAHAAVEGDIVDPAAAPAEPEHTVSPPEPEGDVDPPFESEEAAEGAPAPDIDEPVDYSGLGLEDMGREDIEQALNYHRALTDENARQTYALDAVLAPELRQMGFNNFAEFSAAAAAHQQAQESPEEPVNPYDSLRQAAPPYNPEELFYSEEGIPLQPVKPPAFYDPDAVEEAMEARIAQAKQEWNQERDSAEAESRQAREFNQETSKLITEHSLDDVKIQVQGRPVSGADVLRQMALAQGAMMTDQFGNPAPPQVAVSAAWDALQGLGSELAKSMVKRQKAGQPKTTAKGSVTASGEQSTEVKPPENLEEANRRANEFYGSAEALRIGRGE